MREKFTWPDVPLLLITGVLLVLMSLSWQGSPPAEEMSVWSLMTYLIFVAFYVTTRLILPRSARDFVVVPAVLAFLLGGISMGGGYFIWAYLAAPLLGVLFGASFMPSRRQWPQSVPAPA